MRVENADAEILPVIPRRERCVPNVADARLVLGAGPRKQRHLMCRAVKQVLVVPERGLGAVAMMDVEVHHGHAGRPVNGARVQRRDPDTIEQTKAHGAGRLGMVARRTNGAERIVRRPGHDLVHGTEWRPLSPARPPPSFPARPPCPGPASYAAPWGSRP